MGGATGRESRRGPRSWLVLSTSLIVLSSFLVVAGAQIASAVQCGKGTNVCHLAFRFEDPAGSGSYTDGEPHHALTGATITTTDFNTPPGAPVRVEAEDDMGHRVSSFSGTVTLVTYSSTVPPGETVTLSGNSAVAVNGVATFGGLSFNHSGTFTLQAQSSEIPTAGSPVSASFTVWDKKCEQGTPCVVSKPKSMTAEVDTSASGTYLLSLNADSIACGDSFNHAPGTVSVESTSEETKVLTITIDKSAVKAAPNNGVTFYQVCHQADHTFTTKDGTAAVEDPPGTFTGLLPACPPMPTAADAPCILSKTKDKAGNVVITLLLPAGDPKDH